MVNCLKLIVVILLAIAGTMCKGQSTASATVSANILSPVGIEKNTDFLFRDNANVSSSSMVSTATSANFTVVGNSVDAYSVMVSSNLSLQRNTTSEIINATSSASTEDTAIANTGNNRLRIDATFEFAQNQRPGLYTSKGLEVIIGYN